MSNSGKVKCTCGWSWNKSDSSKKDMYVCHECGRDNSNNMQNGGWLDSYADGGTMQEHQENYNDPQVSLPEGFVGMGNNTKGRNYSPAWGGQFQMGGSVYPVNYVPEAAMGGSIPGAVGFSYARTQSPAPSNGKYAKKTMASAQNGQEMKYYQEGLDFKPKSISKNGGWLSKYDVAQNGEQTENESADEEPQFAPITIEEVVVKKPLTNFGKVRSQISKKNTWEDYAQRYLGNFEKNMGQTINNLPESRKKEYEDYVNKLAFDEYIKKYPKPKGEDRGAYIDRIQSENADSINFEDAYEANAAYNDETDINKWRKSLIGMGSLVLPQVMSRMKQSSDYFSTKEKQAMVDNPISTYVNDVVGTIDPLSIPVEGIYGNKSFGDIASGESADIPMSMRILGDPMMVAFEAAPLLSKGISAGAKALSTEEGLLSNMYKLNPNAGKLGRYNRIVGNNAIEDLNASGLVRAGNRGGRNSGNIGNVSFNRTTAWPSFGEGVPTANNIYAQEIINQGYTPHIISTNREFGVSTLGRHGKGSTMFPIDETGRYLESFPASEVNVFEGIKPHWWKGYKQVKVPKPTSTNSIAPAAENIAENVSATKAPWEMQELPGLHLQSTMDNGAVSKIVEPKSGLINTEQALAIIGKESGGSDKVALIKQGLGENVPKKMDYNDFRKIVQDQLIPLEYAKGTSSKSNYGLGALGYPSTGTKSYNQALTNTEESIIKAKKYLEQNNIKQLQYDFKPVYEVTDSNGFKAVFPTMDEAVAVQKQSVDIANKNIENMVANRDKILAEMKNLPLENETLILSNKTKFGKGSSAHGNPDETLGHIHYLIDSETPDIITATQLQSDALQGTHRIMPKNFNPEISKMQIEKAERAYNNSLATLEKMKVEGAADYEIKQMQEIVDAQKLSNDLSKGHVENFTQKSLLDKDHQSRFLQEFVNYATQKGGINKVRVPTSETAANVQGYATVRKYTDEQQTLLNKISKEKETIIGNSLDNEGFIDYKKAESNPRYIELTKEQEKLQAGVKMDYDNTSKTILKKYSEQPKLIKKLFGEEPKIVTDSKGNTWYEFDIPENFKQGKGQIKAFKQGGIINSDRGQWDHPGEITRISGGNITMKKDPRTGKALTEPLLGIADTGEQQWMYPGEDYNFEGASYVTEIPKRKLAKNGLRQEQKGLVNLNQLTNFTNYNTKQPGGWLDKY
jgi:hypothetical protein